MDAETEVKEDRNPVIVELEELKAQYEAVRTDNDELRESMDEVRQMFAIEDAGWQLLSGLVTGEREEGLQIDDIKQISKHTRAKTAGAALMKRGSDLHGGYVFGRGVEIDDTQRDQNKKGRTPETVRFFEKSVNQESLFSDSARKELQRARFTEGNVIVFCDTRRKEVRRVPISEITGVITNPDWPEEVWAWQRSWTHYTIHGKAEERKVWCYTNRYPRARQKSIKHGTETVPVLEGFTAIDLRANRQIGWTFGVPDSIAGIHWAEAYGQVLRYGQVVNESLAKILFKVVSKSKKGAKEVGIKLRGSDAVGGAASMGEGQDIQLVNSSQRAYDFAASRPLAAMAATAWNVSNIDLLADSSAAGSSYGAAQALTEGVRNAMIGMQQDWTQFHQDIFEAMSLGRPGIHWEPMEEQDKYRQAQALTLMAPALHDNEYRSEVLDYLDIPGDANDIPPTLEARLLQTQGAAAQAASPDQGQGNGTGGQGDADKRDLQDD